MPTASRKENRIYTASSLSRKKQQRHQRDTPFLSLLSVSRTRVARIICPRARAAATKIKSEGEREISKKKKSSHARVESHTKRLKRTKNKKNPATARSHRPLYSRTSNDRTDANFARRRTFSPRRNSRIVSGLEALGSRAHKTLRAFPRERHFFFAGYCSASTILAVKKKSKKNPSRRVR